MHESMATIISDTALKKHCNEIFTLNEKRLQGKQIWDRRLIHNKRLLVIER